MTFRMIQPNSYFYYALVPSKGSYMPKKEKVIRQFLRNQAFNWKVDGRLTTALEKLRCLSAGAAKKFSGKLFGNRAPCAFLYNGFSFIYNGFSWTSVGPFPWCALLPTKSPLNFLSLQAVNMWNVVLTRHDIVLVVIDHIGLGVLYVGFQFPLML